MCDFPVQAGLTAAVSKHGRPGLVGELTVHTACPLCGVDHDEPVHSCTKAQASQGYVHNGAPTMFARVKAVQTY